jgi:hypothetical protein
MIKALGRAAAGQHGDEAVSQSLNVNSIILEFSIVWLLLILYEAWVPISRLLVTFDTGYFLLLPGISRTMAKQKLRTAEALQKVKDMGCENDTENINNKPIHIKLQPSVEKANNNLTFGMSMLFLLFC